MSYHRGPIIQRGKGLGSLLSSLFRKVVPAITSIGKSIIKSPVAKNVLSAAKDAAIDAGLNLASDVVSGKNLKSSLNENIGRARITIGDSLRPRQGKKRSTVKRARSTVSKQRGKKKNIKKRKTQDIFDD